MLERKSLVKSYYIAVTQFNAFSLSESQFVLSVLSVLALNLLETEQNRRIREFDGHGWLPPNNCVTISDGLGSFVAYRGLDSNEERSLV